MDKLVRIFITGFVAISMFACNKKEEKAATAIDTPSKVEIKKEGEKYQLYVNESPFYIKGAGLEYGEIAKLAEHGGNSFRTWRVDNGKQSGSEVLDEAQNYGLKVTMGIDVARERHGFDYNDPVAVSEQLERIRVEVISLKDHPALMIWAIGNELNLRSTNPKVWDAVNEISKMIHEIDPNHLTTTTLAGINADLVKDIKERASDLDLLSIQMYADIVNLPKYIKETDWTGPYMVTEWGATGHWEVAKTAWEAAIENNSSVKTNFYLERYKTAIEPEVAQCLGSYVFLWGQKQERTPTWYGIFMENGNETESVDVMHYLWKGEWPANRSPKLESFELDGKSAYDNVYLEAGKKYKSKVVSTDMDGDELTFVWDVKPESTDLGDGGDFEATPQSLTGLVEGNGSEIILTAPETPGPYRVFIYVNDGKGHTAHANIPFYIN